MTDLISPSPKFKVPKLSVKEVICTSSSSSSSLSNGNGGGSRGGGGEELKNKLFFSRERLSVSNLKSMYSSICEGTLGHNSSTLTNSTTSKKRKIPTSRSHRSTSNPRKRSSKGGHPRITIHSPLNTTPDPDEVDYDDVFYNHNFLSSSYQVRNQRLLPSFSTSPKNLPSVNSPGRKQLQNFGLDTLENTKVLGKGSYGTVILGCLNGKRVAVKVISKQLLSTNRQLKSLEGELNAEVLNHENIVKIHGVYSNQSDVDNTVILMEYIGKSNLQRILEENIEVLIPEFVYKCFYDISSALTHCHDKGVLHLDIKPSNVFVTSKGVCKLGDFGCSHLSGSVSEPNLVGTPGYQSPEYLMSPIPTDKCDVYSFGIFMWQIINKQPHIYDGLHPHTIVFKVVSESLRPNDESKLEKGYESYRSIYNKCWNQDAKRRPSMKETHNEISQLKIRRKSSSSINIRI